MSKRTGWPVIAGGWKIDIDARGCPTMQFIGELNIDGNGSMTDPRLIECAKSIHGSIGYSPYLAWDNCHPDYHAAKIAESRACILKWLEQAPTEQMLMDMWICGDEAPSEEVYTAMCAQAAKELTEK